MRDTTSPATAQRRVDTTGARVVFQQRSLSGTVIVAENRHWRWLELGDGTVQSACARAAPNTLVLPYTRWLLAGALLTPALDDVLLLGLGGGSLARFLCARDIAVTAVELDPVVVQTFHRWFAAAPAQATRPHIVEADARRFVEHCQRTYDLVIVDLFDAAGMLPWVDNPAFLDACRRVLNTGGVLALNSAPDDGDRLDTLLDATRRAFDGRALAVPVPDHANVVVLGLDADPHARAHDQLQRHAAALETRLDLAFVQMWRAINATHASRGRLRYTAGARELGID